jgi:5-methylcytosine-specific restriction endonuclease McrA
MLAYLGREMRLRSEWVYDKTFVREVLWPAQQGRCACCARVLTPHRRDPRSGDRDTIDHVLPQGHGGSDRLGNIVLLTHNCNARKAGRWPTPRLIANLIEINRVLGWRTPRELLT